MNIWDKIIKFIDSDLYAYICLGCFLTAFFLWIILKILEYVQGRIDYKRGVQLMKKYGIPENFEAPDYVVVHISYLIALCEKYGLDSLYEAQDKWDELHSVYWKSKPVSNEVMEILQSPHSSDEKEFMLRALRYGGAVELNNNLEELKKLHQDKFAGRYFFTEQRPSSSEDKPGEEV